MAGTTVWSSGVTTVLFDVGTGIKLYRHYKDVSMPQILFSFAAGVFTISFLPQLPPWWLLSVLVVISLYCCSRPLGRVLAGLSVGLCWGTFCGQQLLTQQLPAEFELRELLVEGVIVGLPDRDQRRSRFQFEVDSCREPGSDTQLPLEKLLLSWYRQDLELQPGQRWQLRVNLRRPRGFVNPGGFDYQQWLLQQGISATGYIRDSADNINLGQQQRWPDSLRFSLQGKLQHMALPERVKGLLQALTVGDGAALSVADWALFSNTGTAHLMVISGLHIGLFALFCYGVGSVLGRLLNLLLPEVPAVLVASGFALLGAWFYAGLSGFGLPATRALAMVAVVLVVRCLRDHVAVANSLLVALAVVAVLDPLAVHSAGFWLSFGAVFGLLWVFSSTVGKADGLLRRLQHLWQPQWVVFVALSTVLLATFGQLPLLSIPINSVAIPWLSLLIVPICLLAVALAALWPWAAELCWQLAGWQLQWLYELLQWLDQWARPLVQLPIPLSLPLLLVLMCCAFLLLLPRGLPGRWLAAVPFVLAFWSLPQRPPLTVTALDVGQGLAVVVSTTNHTLVYDTGAKFSQRFDTGSGVVAPFLRSQGIAVVDRLLVSHGDNDHAGGVSGLLRTMAVADVWSGEPLAQLATATSCRAGMSWQWDGVLFEVLSPAPGQQAEGNNSSCVLLISCGERRVLLPGDIEKEQEQNLLRSNTLVPVDLLLAPHHGSKTSSTGQFVNLVSPQHVIYSAGYRHRFGHPHASVVARYKNIASQQWNTATSGAITLALEGGQWRIVEQRKQRYFFWQ